MPGWLDISVPLSPDLVCWPGDPRFGIERVASIERGDVCNTSRLAMCAHAGTHVDAPLHFVNGGADIAAMPIDALLGPCRVIAIRDPVAIGSAELLEHDIRPGERILFRTRNSDCDWHARPFDTGFVHISQPAAAPLVACGVLAVGIDYLSVGAFAGDGVETHQTLLGAGVWIIEGLDLARIAAGRYELACLPLRIPAADGAPARAAIRPVADGSAPR